MSVVKEFRAKTVDQAIKNACRFFAVDRDGLEIDIISGGSTGIFGLGAKKAVIRAKKRQGATWSAPETPKTPDLPDEAPVDLTPENKDQPQEPLIQEVPETPKPSRMETQPSLTLEDQDQLQSMVQEVLTSLLQPISSSPHLTVTLENKTINAHIDDDQNSGLIIGRDGQTIAALQYMINRIVSKSWPGSPHIQLDAGDYRQKQQEQLQEIALFLSDKAKRTGKVQSTRPLSAFHRRLVHMALQEDRSIQTRSKGEGYMKRVLILPAKGRKSGSRAPKEPESHS